MNNEQAKKLFNDPNKLRSLKRYKVDTYDEIVEMTNFLPENALLKARLWHIMNDVMNVVTCKMCDNPVKWDDAKKSALQVYRQYCSHKCLGSDPDFQKKRKDTITKRYGKGLKSIVAKTQETNLKKYGVKNAMMLETTKQKRNDTCMEKFNVDNPAKVKAFMDKRSKTNLSKFGYEHASQSDECKTKTIQTYTEKHGNLKNRYTASILKYKNTMYEKYDVDAFPKTWISPESLEKIEDKDWLEGQYKMKSATEIGKILNIAQSTVCRYLANHDIEVLPRFPIPKDSETKLKDKNWLYHQYISNNISCSGIAHMLNVSNSLVLKRINSFNIPIQYSSSSLGEIELREFISSFNIDIITNDKKTLNGKEIDILIPSHGIGIEFNGNYWHSELKGKDKNYHLSKTNGCNDKNIQLIHILESEWIQKRDIVKSRLANMLGQNKTIFARKCEIVKVSNDTKKLFLDENHLQGDVRSKINIGLMYNNELMALMTFGKTRFSKKYEYELLRFVNKMGITVVGGASRLFNRFIQDYNPQSIVTYGDLRYGTGNLYATLGFDFLHKSNPNYKYFHYSDAMKLYSRIKFQKHKLSNVLYDFKPELTEWENMKNNGYNRIWDCGNSVWGWSIKN